MRTRFTWFGMLAVMAALIVAPLTVSAEDAPSTQPAAAAEPAAVSAPADDAFASERDRLSYAVGVQFGTSLSRDQVDLNLDVFMTALKDVAEGRPLAMSPDEVMQTVQAFGRQLQQQQRAAAQAAAAANEAQGHAYLAENAKKDGVHVTDSGLQYRVLEEGTGPSPKPTDMVRAHYSGRLLDGTEFDSSYKRGSPAIFAVQQVIEGWQEALPLMKEGAKWELTIPANLAYGEGGAGAHIPPNSTLIFEVELLEVVAPPQRDSDIPAGEASAEPASAPASAPTE